MGRVDSKVAVVTGGSMGIGRAASLMLAKEGAHVAVVDIDDDAGRKTALDIRSTAGMAEYWHMDVSDSTQVATVLAEIDKRFGKINVLVNNAGIAGPQMPSDEVSEEDWDRVIKVDAKGVFLCTKYGAPYLKKAGGGSIINISSIYGLVGGVDPPYHAAKGAVRLLTKSDAFYYGPFGIRVNSIHPGHIMTPMVEGFMPKDPEEARQFKKDLDNLTLLGHIGEPDDIAYAIVYLASDESKFMTGAEIVIDGGFTSV